MIGAARDAQHVRRVVLFAPHTAFFGDYLPAWRIPMFLAWHVLMPLTTAIAGYFPGRALRLGEDLPRGFALEWAGRLHRAIGATASDRQRWGPALSSYGQVAAQALAISVTDDAFAPPAAAAGALALYPAMTISRKVVSPGDLQVRTLGHMAFLRRRTGPWFWEQAAAWLLQRQARVDYPSHATTA
jgi:predicted alpha/beta hydrolase